MKNYSFQPDYHHLVDAANNREATRMPLYEHAFDMGLVGSMFGRCSYELLEGSYQDKVQAFRTYCECGLKLGYDCVGMERCLHNVVQNGQALMGRAPAIIHNMDDLEAYPWDKKKEEYVAKSEPYFDALREALPEGMKAVGGVGTGMFEMIQDFVPFQDLVFLQADEPETYERLWQQIGNLLYEVWEWFLPNYKDIFAVCRIGDDLGFKSGPLLPPEEFRKHAIPPYKRVIDLVHQHERPFLWHSCGKIYEVMDDFIEAGIDAKHSNEDAIDRFDVWVEKYGDRIGNFGGVEMNIMTLNTPEEVRQYVLELLERIAGNGGLAIGTGNQISSYTRPENWIAMTEAVRDWRGDKEV